MIDRVFCKECRHLAYPDGDGTNEFDFTCFAPENLKQKCNFLELKGYPVQSPRELNWNNNCPYFKAKGVN